MSDGVRAELAIEAPDTCPVAAASAAAGEPADEVSWSQHTESVTEEFRIRGDGTAETETVFSNGRTAVHRFERAADRHCPCAVVEAHGSPVADVHAAGGTLFVTFHAPTVDTVREVVQDLAQAFDVTVRRLLQDGSPTTDEVVTVDLGRLTERQREVLETATAMGFFEHPKAASARDVAAVLGIAPSTFTEHRAAAQRKLLDELLPGSVPETVRGES